MATPDVTYTMKPGGVVNFEVEFGAAETTKRIRIRPGVNRSDAFPSINLGRIAIPDWTNTVSLDVKFLDPDDATFIWGNEDTALAQNATRSMSFPTNGIPIAEDIDMLLTLSGAPGAGGGTITGKIVSSFSMRVGGGSFDGTLTSNITMGSYYISGDGDDEGMTVDASGNVTFSGNATVTGNVITDTLSANTATFLSHVGKIDDGAGAIAHKFGNTNELTNPTSEIAGFYSDNITTLVAQITNKGGFHIAADGTVNNAYAALRFGDGDSYINEYADDQFAWYAGGNTIFRSIGTQNIGWGLLSQFGASGTACASMGVNSGAYGSGTRGVHHGSGAGYYCSGDDALALSTDALAYNQGDNCIGAGEDAGYANVIDQQLFIDQSNSQIPLYGGSFDTDQARIGGDLVVLNVGSLGAEVFTETDFATHANWDVTGSVDDSGGNVVFSGAGTLTQTSGNFNTALVGNSWYKLEMTVSGVSGTPAATITTGICDTATPIRVHRNGTWDAWIYTKASPGDFVIDCTAGNFTIDDITLKEIQGGDIVSCGGISPVNANASALINETASATNPTVCPDRSDDDCGMGLAAADQLSIVAGGVELMRYVENGTADYVETKVGTVVTPSGDTAMAAGDSLTVTKGLMRVAGSGGAVTLTSTPHLVDGQDGQIVVIQGTHDTNTLTLQDEGNLANSGCALAGGADMTLGLGDTIMLVYNSGDDKWYEISRSNN